MAKNENTAAPSIVVPEVEAGGSGDSRSVILNVKMNDGTTKAMRRTDYIRQRAQSAPMGSPEQPSRAQIKKEVEALQGKPVQYQVIFAATKDLYPKSKSKTEGEAGEGAAAE